MSQWLSERHEDPGQQGDRGTFPGFRVILLLLSFLGLALVAGGLLPGCSSHVDPWQKAGDRVKVVVTFAPLESLVKKVGGDHVAVVCLTTTTGPHHYEASSRESVAVRKANLLVANGLGLDGFAEKLKRASANTELKLLDLGHELEEYDEEHKTKLLIEVKKVAGAKGGHDHAHGDGHHHDSDKWDPHIWLGFASTVPVMIDAIRDALKEIDEDHVDEYTANAEKFKKDLINLGTDASKALANKKDRQLITFHDSLRYLARDLKLEIVDTVQIAPGESPTSDRYKSLINLCKDKKIKYIATEPQYPETQAKKIKEELKAKDVDVKLIQIDPLETANSKDLNADWYINQMQKNIEVLEKVLE